MRLLKIIILTSFLTSCAGQLTPTPSNSEGSQTSSSRGASQSAPKSNEQVRSAAEKNRAQHATGEGNVVQGPSTATRENTRNTSDEKSSGEHLRVSQLDRPRKIKGEKLEDQVRGGAVIIFMRSSVVASAVNAQVYEMKNGAPALVGDMRNNTRLHHELEPGRHVFMLIADTVDYLVVEGKANHTYYAVVKPSMGVWKPKFDFVPIKAERGTGVKVGDGDAFLHFGDEEVSAMLSAMTPIVYSKEFKQHEFDQAKIEQLYQDSWQSWNSQGQEGLDSKTLLRHDGRKVQ